MNTRIITFLSCTALATMTLIFFIFGAPPMTKSPSSTTSLTLHSPAFNDGAPIPAEYTCSAGSQNISPELQWTVQGAQAQNIKSYVLIVDDPDAQKVVGKTFVHWTVLLPGTCTHLPKGISSGTHSTLTSIYPQAREIINDAKTTTYYGPCPPTGTGIHHYRFTLFATNQPLEQLSTILLTNKPCTAEECNEILGSSIIAKTVLVGTYENK